MPRPVAKRSQGKIVTRRIYMVLAALMLADGAHVTSNELAHGLYERPVAPSMFRWRVRVLRWHGVADIQTHRREFGVPHRGYCLATLPSDEHLEPMLAMVPAVKRSRWWIERSQTHTTRLSA